MGCGCKKVKAVTKQAKKAIASLQDIMKKITGSK